MNLHPLQPDMWIVFYDTDALLFFFSQEFIVIIGKVIIHIPVFREHAYRNLKKKKKRVPILINFNSS